MSSDTDHPPRKLLKPLLEKLRRERLNRSLERLRLLLLEGTGDPRLRNPKVEKAEILQKTLQFLREQPRPESPSPEELERLLVRRYRSGYRACLARAARFLRDIPGTATTTCPVTPPGDGTGGPGGHGEGAGGPGYDGGGLGLSLGTQGDPKGGTGWVGGSDSGCVVGGVTSHGLCRGVGCVSSGGLGCVLNGDPTHGLGCVLSGDPTHGLGHVLNGDPTHGLGCVLSGDPTHGLGYVLNGDPTHGLGRGLGHVLNGDTSRGLGRVSSGDTTRGFGCVLDGDPNHVPVPGLGRVTSDDPNHILGCLGPVFGGDPTRGLGRVPDEIPAGGLGHVSSCVPNPIPEASTHPRPKRDLEGLPEPPQRVWRPWP